MTVGVVLTVSIIYSYRWVVENQVGRKNLVIDDCDAKQSVYIFGCKDSVLQIQGNFVTHDQLASRWLGEKLKFLRCREGQQYNGRQVHENGCRIHG